MPAGLVQEIATLSFADHCATARRVAASEVSLPIHPYLSRGEAEKVVEAVNGWSG